MILKISKKKEDRTEQPDADNRAGVCLPLPAPSCTTLDPAVSEQSCRGIAVATSCHAAGKAVKGAAAPGANTPLAPMDGEHECLGGRLGAGAVATQRQTEAFP